MGLKALYCMFLILICLGIGSNTAIAQTATANPNAGVFSLQNNYQLFSPQFNYQNEILSDVQPGHFGAVWLGRVYGQNAELTSQSNSTGGVDAWFGTKYKLLDNLEFIGVFRAKFEAGHSQDFLGDLEPTTGIFMREGALQFTPGKVFMAKAGVISQDWMGMPMLMSRRSFPGGLVKLTAPLSEKFDLSVISQWLIPTSTTLSTRTVGRESTPQFMTHMLSGNYNDQNGLKLGANVSTYHFRDLPSSVANESIRRGNTKLAGSAPTPNFAFFEYDFRGWFYDVSGRYHIPGTNFEPQVSFSRIRNTHAPETYNDGQSWIVGNIYHMESHMFYVGYENFFVESDVTPAFYGSGAYGFTNKKGHGVEAWWLFKKHNFRVRAEFYKANVINQTGLQQDQNYFYLGVETGYDRI